MNTLKKNYEFQNVMRKGKFFVGKQITVYITKIKENKTNYFGIAVSKKACKAVKRNFIKRKIRENYRLIEPKLKKGYSIVFLWNNKAKAEQADFYVIANDMKKAFEKEGLWG